MSRDRLSERSLQVRSLQNGRRYESSPFPFASCALTTSFRPRIGRESRAASGRRGQSTRVELRWVGRPLFRDVQMLEKCSGTAKYCKKVQRIRGGELGFER